MGVRPLCTLFACVAVLAASRTSTAGTIAVTTTVDELTTNGACSLREAIRNANADAAVHPDCAAGSGADTILLPAGTYVLTILGRSEDASATGDLDITQDLTITGAGAGLTVIDANGNDRVFQIIGSTTRVALAGLTVRGGDPGLADGGGIWNGGQLSLSDVTLTGNAGQSGGGLFNNAGTISFSGGTIDGNMATSGGGLFCAGPGGTVTLSSVTVSRNTASFGAGIDNSGTLTLLNATLSENAASVSGGGLANFLTATLTHVTIEGNIAPAGSGGGVVNRGGELLMANSIVAGSGSAGGCSALLIVSGGGNLSDDATCPLTQPTDLTSTNPLLGPLAMNPPGTTATHALLPGSPAIDTAVSGSCLPTDQRGVPRPQGAACDRGAYEVAAAGAALAAVPALPVPGLIGLALLLTATGLVVLRRRARTQLSV